MIYQPKNVLPKTGSAVNSSEDIVISMDIQTNSYIIQYKFDFYEKTSTGWGDTPVYVYNPGALDPEDYIYNNESLSITLDSMIVPFIVGGCYGWKVRLYQQNPNIVVTSGSVGEIVDSTNFYIQQNPNIQVGMYIKREGVAEVPSQISAYDADTGLVTLSSVADPYTAGENYQVVSDFIDTVPLNIFYYWQEPTVTIDQVPLTITERSYTFTGICSDDQSPIIWHQFDLYRDDGFGNKILIDSTGEVESARLEYTYDLFMSGETYYIRLTIQNEFNQIVSSDFYEFEVSYQYVEYLQQPSASCNANQNAINVSWIAPTETVGETLPVSKPNNPLEYTSYSTTNAGVTYTASGTHIKLSGYSTAMEPSIRISLSEKKTFYPDKTYVLTMTSTGTKSHGDSSCPVLYFEDESNVPIFNLKPADFPYTFTPTVEKTLNDIMVLPVYHATYTDYEFEIKVQEVVPVENPSDAQYLYDTPFNGVNSLYTNNYEVEWDKEEGICTLSDDFNISFVFNLARSFFVDADGVSKENVVLFSVESDGEDEDDIGNFSVEINKHTLVFKKDGSTFLSKNFFDGVASAFVLSSVQEADAYKDYVWQDSGTWNDSYYWTEGLDFQSRMCDKWWKVEITPTFIRFIQI